MKRILGTAQFGLDYGISNTSGQVSQETVLELLQEANRNGVQLLDTAIAYGNAHTVVGECLGGNPDLCFEVMTKFTRSSLKSMTLSEQAKRCCAELNVDSLYAFSAHTFTELKESREWLDELSQLKSDGIIGRIGVSLYGESELEWCVEHPQIDLIQIPYNLLDRSPRKQALLESLKHAGVEIHFRSLFLQGLFFLSDDRIPVQLEPLKPALCELRKLSSETEIPINGLALRYGCSNMNADGIVFGVENLEQMHEILAVSLNPLTRETIQKIESIQVDNTKLLNPSNW